MTQYLGDLGQSRAGAQHLAGCAVPEPVRARTRQPGPVTGGPYDRRDTGGRQPVPGREHPQEQQAARQGRPAAAGVAGQRLAGIGGKRQPFPAASLAADHDLAVPPVDVIEGQGRDLPDAQPQP